VSSFSLASSALRAASHSARDTSLEFSALLACSTSLAAMSIPFDGKWRQTVGSWPLQRHDRPHLHAPEAYRWKPRGHLYGLVEVSGVDEKEPANLLLRLGKGTVGGGHLTVPDPHGHGHLNWFEGLRHNEVAALLERRAVGRGFVHEGLALALGHGGQFLLLGATHEQIFHGSEFPIGSGGGHVVLPDSEDVPAVDARAGGLALGVGGDGPHHPVFGALTRAGRVSPTADLPAEQLAIELRRALGIVSRDFEMHDRVIHGVRPPSRQMLPATLTFVRPVVERADPRSTGRAKNVAEDPRAPPKRGRRSTPILPAGRRRPARVRLAGPSGGPRARSARCRFRPPPND